MMDDSWGVMRPHPHVKGALLWPPKLVGMRAHIEQRSSETQSPFLLCETISSHSPRLPSPSPGDHQPTFCPHRLGLFWTFHVNGVTQYVVCYAWFLPLGIMLSRFVGIQHALVLHFL